MQRDAIMGLVFIRSGSCARVLLARLNAKQVA